MSWPNVLTATRLLLVPMVAFLLLQRRLTEAGALFAVAALTDALDGWLARRLKQITRLGQLLDPLADKALVDTVLVCSALLELLPLWFAFVTLARDLFVLGGGLVGRWLTPDRDYPPGRVGKTGAALQMLVLVLVLVPWPEWLPLRQLLQPLLLAAAAATLLSAALYTVALWRSFAARSPSGA